MKAECHWELGEILVIVEGNEKPHWGLSIWSLNYKDAKDFQKSLNESIDGYEYTEMCIKYVGTMPQNSIKRFLKRILFAVHFLFKGI
jgi:hypothetical protein